MSGYSCKFKFNSWFTRIYTVVIGKENNLSFILNQVINPFSNCIHRKDNNLENKPLIHILQLNCTCEAIGCEF